MTPDLSDMIAARAEKESSSTLAVMLIHLAEAYGILPRTPIGLVIETLVLRGHTVDQASGFAIMLQRLASGV